MGDRSTHRVRAVGVRELKTRLGTYLRQVRQGVRIVVTDRGEPVAELRPLDMTGRGDYAELDKLVATGMLTRAPRAPCRRSSRSGTPVVQSADTVVEERRDRV